MKFGGEAGLSVFILMTRENRFGANRFANRFANLDTST
jgi:hypothetical protein